MFLSEAAEKVQCATEIDPVVKKHRLYRFVVIVDGNVKIVRPNLRPPVRVTGRFGCDLVEGPGYRPILWRYEFFHGWCGLKVVEKENGRTLHGQVATDFAYVREYLAECPQIRGVTMVFGNIDVRHHICRLGADWKHLYREWKRFGDSLDIEVEYSLPWPAEFEGRRLPKTGWYKGQPFWGTQEERAEVIRGVWGFAGEIGMNVVRYPEEWLDMDPEIYAKERMEKPQSVHLSPEFYRRHEWRAIR